MRTQLGRNLAAAVRDQQHRDACADGIRDGQDDRSPADVLPSRHARDRCQHGAGAWREDEPEGCTEQESSSAGAVTREPCEWALQGTTELRDQQRRGENEQHHDRELS
jgi:hypothetical protein